MKKGSPSGGGSQKSKPAKTAKTAAKARRAHGKIAIVRLLEMHAAIEARKYPNCSTFAKQFGIHRATVLEYFTHMRDSMRLPLEFDHKRNGYYFTRPVPFLPKAPITTGEMLGLLIAQRVVKSLDGTPFGTQITAALEKVTAEMTDEVACEWQQIQQSMSFVNGSSVVKFDPVIYEEVNQAVKAGEELEIHYRGLGATSENFRRIRPLHCALLKDGWVVFATYPGVDGDYRTFYISRMKTAKRTGVRFERDPNFTPAKVLAHSIGVYGGKPERVRLRLGPVPAHYLSEHRLHTTQQITSNPDGTAELTMEVAVTPELKREVLSWGEEVEVLEPDSLREGVHASARKILERA